jgi:hypothetical protein
METYWHWRDAVDMNEHDISLSIGQGLSHVVPSEALSMSESC